MNSFKITALFMLALAFMVCDVTSGDAGDTKDATPVPPEPAEDVPQEKVDYAKGSVCGYCTYCKFCELCDADCPCETSRSKPNCKMCKYCKYCYLCSAICDTICTPGGILDRVSGSIVNSLPSVNHDEVDSDIESVKTWIDHKKDEL
ncbi:sarcoplasmic reticulum histidine-rich calcium-binding protein-like [Littorina saxatilis]|uniref:Sarcoplasmic reticulum histidine-rich calcium-binding protein n=1 Tax=Littorina saxatilis TaxID=31220 RepID=A0AAN9GE88_9CAEN|eukprot:GHVL01041984.1.p1 GENE.GHVL01041984.1~~GHVL01041984.1.p1  ORF type:complete len:147 (+),score=16.19 GHVL01041984.1:16-456(+)